MKKILNWLIVISIFALMGGLLLPISLFENKINNLLKKNLSPIFLKVKGIDYQLLSFNKLNVKKLYILYNDQKCNLSNVKILLKPLKLLDNAIVFRDIEIGAIDCKFVQFEKKQNSKMAQNNENEYKILIDKILIKKINISSLQNSISNASLLIRDFKIQKNLKMKFDLNIQNVIYQGKDYQELSVSGAINDKKIVVNKTSIQKPYVEFNESAIDFTNKGLINGNINIKELEVRDFVDKAGRYTISSGILRGNIKLNEVRLSPLSFNNVSTNLLIKKIALKGIDIDNLLNSYIDSNKNSYLDLAGIFALGPIGLLVSKTTKITKSLPDLNSGKSNIESFYLNTQIHSNIIELKDFSAVTDEHVLVLKGTVNIDNKKMDLNFAPVDENGCPIFIQEINGTILKPEINKMKTFTGNLFSPITDLIKRSKNMISTCKKFYSGQGLNKGE